MFGLTGLLYPWQGFSQATHGCATRASRDVGLGAKGFTEMARLVRVFLSNGMIEDKALKAEIEAVQAKICADSEQKGQS